MADQSYGEKNLQTPTFLSAQSLFGEIRDPSRLTAGEFLVDVKAESTLLSPNVMTSLQPQTVVLDDENINITGATSATIDFSLMSGRQNVNMVERPDYLKPTQSSSELMAEEIKKLQAQVTAMGSSLKTDVDDQISTVNSTLISLVSRTNKDFSEEFTVSGGAGGFLFDVRNAQASIIPGWV